MKENPLQVISNTRQYMYVPQPTPGGGLEDFYGGRDDEFIEHKKKLRRQVGHVQAYLERAERKVAVVKVELNPSALAKSHRPMNSLFVSSKSPHIGGGKIGSLLFQVTPKSLEWLEGKISNAEEVSNLTFNEKSGREKYKPTLARSEVGAIDRISLYDRESKINFSATDAINWISDNEIDKGYLIELFEYINPTGSGYQIDSSFNEELKRDLTEKLHRLGGGIVLSCASKDESNKKYLYLRVYKPQSFESKVDFNQFIKIRNRESFELDLDPERHDLIMRFLVDSPLIKKINLPPRLSKVSSSTTRTSKSVTLPQRQQEQNYPTVGLIDSGIRNEELKPWALGVSDAFELDECDPDHGSQVASLLIAAQCLNPDIDGIEDDGCLVYDIWTPIHKEKNSFNNNFEGISEFFDWLDFEIKAATDLGVRVFNFSINLRELVKDDSYSFAAMQLDRISEKHNVIFVVSAGNLEPIDFRAKWPSQYAITSDIDRLQQPAESVCSISVGALNPPGCDLNIHGTPTVYSRRGPGVGMGVKPDVVHYGGFSGISNINGLISLNSENKPLNEGGTSFSAPLIAKTLASIEHKLNKNVSRNTLICLLVHHSDFPRALDTKHIETSIKRRFVGFGTPCKSEDMLVTDEHTVTLVFEGRLKRSEVSEFEFMWPDSLVKNGKCRGTAVLTLVYDPVLNSNFGAEYCRVNVDSFLQQQKLDGGEWKYRKNCDSIWTTKIGKDAYYERSQIEHGLKWWPIKKYKKIIQRGVGESQNWRLKLSSTEREPGDFPENGIEFCAIITIQDHKKSSNTVFDELRHSLNTMGIEIKPIGIDSQIDIGVN